jgi:hypothetical protein
MLLILGVIVDHGLQGGEDLLHRLDELRHGSALFLDVIDDAGDISIHDDHSNQKYDLKL